MLKLDFQRAVLNRIPKIKKDPDRHWRQVLFICDEYQEFATTGRTSPTATKSFFPLPRAALHSHRRHAKHQLAHDALPGESWRTLLQSFRTKIFLTQTDGFSAKTASELCGKEDHGSELQHLGERARRPGEPVDGQTVAHMDNVTTAKSYNAQHDFLFDTKTFTEFKNAQTITLAYDGFNPLPPTLIT